jgi:Zn-dependent peptidase ImmA (M78 family)
MGRLAKSGFPQSFVRTAILPEWWEEALSEDANLMPEVEIRVARFLGLPIEAIRDPQTPLAPPAYPEAHLRRIRDIDKDRLSAAIHSAIRIAGAVTRALRDQTSPLKVPPSDACLWREQLLSTGASVSLATILGDLWAGGVPVVPLDSLPSPSFQGIACVAEGRPVILLGHSFDQPGRVAFHVAHEVGHVAAGDCEPGQPVVDEADEIRDESEMEANADLYATRLLVGGEPLPEIKADDFRMLARRALELEQKTRVDSSVIIFAWAARTLDYAAATRAVNALYRGRGARQLLRQYFDHHVDIESVSETDRALLSCVHGGPHSHALAH